MLKKSLPILVGAAVVAGCVGLGANAAYGTAPGLEHSQSHTTVLWAYPAYPDIAKPQPYVTSVAGANIHAFDEYVKQSSLCGQTFQVDVYKSVVKGQRVETLWSKGYLEYAHDGGFLAYGLGYTPYKVLTEEDTACTPAQTPTPEPTTPPESPEPSPTDTPTSTPTSSPEPSETPSPTGEPSQTPEPTGTPTVPTETPSGSPSPTDGPTPTTEPTSPGTPIPTTPTEPEPTSTATTPSSPAPTPTRSTEPTQSPMPSGTATAIATSESSPGVPTKADSGTTPKAQPTGDTARTLAYTGVNAAGPLIAAAVLVVLGVITLLVVRRRKGL